MSLETNLAWVKSHVSPDDITGKRVLDVGSRNWEIEVEGKKVFEPVATDWLTFHHPSALVGIDEIPGMNVHFVMSAIDLSRQWGFGSFDTVFCLEVLEHIYAWENALENIKAVTAFGGLVVLTTRMPGFPLHGYPLDFWRFQARQFEAAFSGYNLVVEEDGLNQGIYVLARKRSWPVPINVNAPVENHVEK